jgi:hypothetical protein
MGRHSPELKAELADADAAVQKVATLEAAVKKAASCLNTFGFRPNML